MGHAATPEGGAGATGEVRYRIDAVDRLVAFNPQWDRFALENGAPELAASDVRAREIWAFIADLDTRHLHQRLLERVRRGNRLTALPFRCDSPDTRRYMEMDVIPLPDGEVEYRCRLLRAERRAPARVGMGAGTGAQTFAKMCSWCKRVEVAPGVWKELEEAIRELGLFERDPPPAVSHGICEDCQKEEFPGAGR